MAEGGAAGVADRARNERLTSIVDRERLTRMQGLLAETGIHLSKRQIAMDQNGDLSLNLTPETAAALWKAGLITESQLGAIADCGHARFSFSPTLERASRGDWGRELLENSVGGGEL